MPAQEYKKFYAKNRKTWRTWLKKNHATSKGVWLIYYIKSSGKPRVPYEDAVEEALCFGWIDSTAKKLDKERTMQRFTPRKPKSGWSLTNKKRVEKLIEAGLMTEAGQQKIEEAQQNGSWNSLDKIYARADQLELPADLEKALAKNKKAKKNFDGFPTFVKRQFLYWINSAKRSETRKARIQLAVQMAKANKKPDIKGFHL